MLPGFNPILSDHILSDSGIGPSCINWTSTPYHIPLSRCQLPRVSILKGPPPRESQKSLKLLAVDLRTRLTWLHMACGDATSTVANYQILPRAQHDSTTQNMIEPRESRDICSFLCRHFNCQVVCGMCPQKKQLKNLSWDPRFCRVEETAPLLKIWSWQVKCYRTKQKCLQTKGNNFGLAFKCPIFLPLVLPLAMS